MGQIPISNALRYHGVIGRTVDSNEDIPNGYLVAQSLPLDRLHAPAVLGFKFRISLWTDNMRLLGACVNLKLDA